MNRKDFDNIVKSQTEITFDNARKKILKVVKICGFLNLRGYDPIEKSVKPTRYRSEIQLIEDNDTYSIHLSKHEDGVIPYANYSSWYGVYENYLIKNIGSDCATVMEMLN